MSKIKSKNLSLTKIETKLTWKKLILKSSKIKQIKKLEDWLNENNYLIDNNNFNAKSHLTLFHGPPGTGKTLTASLLGKYTNKPVYRVDLSIVVSKYIGETEKNLEKIFSRAENKDWILFFDEADALFGKRTNVRDAHDKYANQEFSYLLQQIKNHLGMVILSVNMKKHINDTYIKRFDTIIEFNKPSFIQRKIIWFKKSIQLLK